MTETTIAAQHNVTFAQIDACTLVRNAATNELFYSVDSASEPGTSHSVRFHRVYQRMTCTCKAGQQGIPCWHKRAVAACEAIRKAERAERAAEAEASRPQAEVKAEATIEALVRGGLDREAAIRVARAKPAPISKAKGTTSRPFSLLA